MPIGDVPKDCGGASKHCTLRQYPLWGLPGAQRLFFVVLCTVSPVLRRVQARDRQKIGWDGGVLLYMNFHLAQLMGLVPVRIAGMVVQLFKWQILFLPWNLILFSVSTVAGVLLRFLVLTGASLPSGYADKDTLVKMRSVVEHMHSREDQYRRKIKEQQEQSEALRVTNKKYMAKLKKLSMEMERYQQEQTSREPGGIQPVDTAPSWHVHVAVLLATFLTLWLLSAPWVRPISKKVVHCLLWPLILTWIFRLSLPRRPSLLRDASHSLAYFLIGYISCHWINAAI